MSKFWNEEREATLREMAGDASGEVTQARVAEIAAELDATPRQVGSKLRSMDYAVQKASDANRSAWDESATAELRSFLESNKGKYTYEEISAAFPGGFSAKSVQGKVLSMELTDHVRAAEPRESVRVYTTDEEDTFVKMANAGKFIEEIAEALGKSINSVRGKALSLSKSIEGFTIPRQKESHASAREDVVEALGNKINTMSVEDIAKETGKTVRGVKTLLTRRRLACADYDGAAKAEKRDAKRDAS